MVKGKFNMRRLKTVLRNLTKNKNDRVRLKNRDFSVIASNCNGAFILHDLGLKFNSPFVNLWMNPKDYIKFLRNIQFYLKCEMRFIEEPDINYPIGVLDDVKIYFQHYATEEEAKQKWVERSKRINFQNLFIMFTDRDGCTYQDLCDFESLPYKNKVVFTHRLYPEFDSAYYIKGWEKQECVGLCANYVNKFSWKKYYDQFDYVSWFNQSVK